MSEEKKSEVTEEVKEARKLSEEELENVNGGIIYEHPERAIARGAIRQQNEVYQGGRV